MNKAHSPINWQNKPSVNTPINETNLNKMDSTIGILDDRIIAHDTSKLDKSTANTMVKDVTFNESTGIFTITLLNGSTKTLDTKLEKIATNFRYDYSTQKLILTLVDGTTQEIDMSALLTQYEFTDSDTIGWEVAEDGTVKAKVFDGSITEDMLQPNYLADIKVETAKSESYMNSAKTSEINASSSANLAQSYAVGGTGTRDGEDTDNAKYYSENAKPVAQTITGTNPTVTNSANAPLIYGKIKGYTLQDGEPTPDNPIDIQGLGDSGTIEVRTCRKNKFGLELIRGNNGLSDNGVTCTISEKRLILNGTATEKSSITFYTKKIDGKNSVISFSQISGTQSGNVLLYTFTSSWTKSTIIPLNGSLKSNSDTLGVFIIVIDSGATVNNLEVAIQVECDTATPYEPYTETTATIPIDTLYEGDYLEVYADGSGKIVRENDTYTFNGTENISVISNNVNFPFVTDIVSKYIKTYSNNYDNNFIKCTHLLSYSSDNIVNNSNIDDGIATFDKAIYIRIAGINTVEDLSAWLKDNSVKFIYKLATPTETPLTAEQVEQFKKLYTFDNVTNFFCDGEITARYYCNTDSGDTVGMLQKQAKENLEQIKNDLLSLNKTITETYTTNTDFSKIVGGTVSSAGLTNIEYTIPTEISSAGLGTQSNNGGTLVDALKTSTSKITEFFGTLYDEISQVEEDDTILDFSNNDVTGSLNVFRHKLSEGTYLLDIKVTITSITETLSGNGPSVDLTLQDIGFEDNIIAIRESECLLASYYPLIVNGSSYCLGGGMVSTENSTKGFYLRFLPHKNTKGSISSNNKSVLSGTMMIKVVEQQL